MKHTSYQHLKSRLVDMTFVKSRCRLVSLFLPVFLALLFFANVDTVWSSELKIHVVAPPPPSDTTVITRPDQLPESRLAHGHRNIVTVWFAGQTDRYRHGVFGDKLEASRLVVETDDGEQLDIVLPATRVFEDVEPRLADVNGDNSDEILVVESDIQLGASLAVYGIVEGRIVKITATPFIGLPHRWLNPVGVGDFDGDGHADIALVATPHIGGILRLYRLTGATLSLFAEYSGVSTHRLGSTELGLGRVISATPRDRLLVPNQARRALMLLEWSDNGWQEHTRVTLPGELISSLIPVDVDRWRVRLDTGTHYEIQLSP
jgi:hypothetical protein